MTALAEPAPRREHWWMALWLALGALIVLHCWFSSYNHDEIEHLHASWLIAQGALPFRDFLEQKHPTIWFLAAPLVSRFHSVQWLVFCVRLYGAVCGFATLWVFQRLLRRLSPGVDWRLPTALLVSSFIFVRSLVEFRADPLMNLLLQAGILSWVAFLRESKLRRAAAAGLLFGLAYAFLQKAAVPVALVLGVSLALAVGDRACRARAGKLFGGVALAASLAAVPAVALFAAMKALGIWGEFWFWNYTFNRVLYLQAEVREHFSALETIGQNLAAAPVLWILGLWGAWRVARSRAELSKRVLLLVAGGYFVFLCLNRFPFTQYYLELLPWLALFSAEVLAGPRGGRRRAWLERAVLFSPVILAAIVLLYPTNRSQREVDELLLAKVAPGQRLFVPPPQNPVFRRDAAFFWYNAAMISRVYQDLGPRRPNTVDALAQDREAWGENPPEVVLLEEPASLPYAWDRRKAAYRSTAVPRLLERR